MLKFTVAYALAVCFGDLLGTPGIEAALAAGLVLPPALAASNALRVARERGFAVHEPRASVACALTSALLSFGVVVAAQLARVALDPACFEPEGLAFMALGPLPGMLLASLVGEGVGRRVARERRAALAAVGVCLAPVVVAAFEFHATPAVFVFSLFAGYFPGPIYDENVGVPAELLTYRLLSCVLFLACLLALGATSWSAGARRRLVERTCAAALVSAFVALTVVGARFGHRTNVARIDEALGGTYESARCRLHVPSEMSARSRRRLGAECDAHVRGIATALGLRVTRAIDVFVYRSAEEKGALVGARETYVAKPWRAEVHVQRESFPHTVLRHELVHVISGALAPGPWRTPGRLGGWVTNPALVEGLAVALAPDGRDGLSTEQVARTLLELGRLPRLGALEGLGFLGGSSHESYGTAGAYIAHVHRTRGRDAVVAMLRRGTLEVTPREERAFRASLAGVVVPAGAVEIARVRALDRGFVSTRCARRRARVEARIGEALARDDHGAARARCAELLALDPRDARARALDAETLTRAGALDRAERALASLDPTVPRALVGRVERVLADARFFSGAAGADAARRLVEQASARPGSEASLRALDARRLALSRAPVDREVLMRALVDFPSVTAAGTRRTAELSALATRDPLAAYLLARRLVEEDEFDLALPLVEQALASGLGAPRLDAEARRMRARALVAAAVVGTGSLDAARAAVDALAADASTQLDGLRLADLLR